MRILHTSDWHLGRQFHGLSLDEDHEHIFVQILAMIDDERPDVVIIAGDIFDRANPPQSAIGHLSQFLTTVRAASDAAIVMIAGNHDSAAQIGAMGVLADGGAAIVRGPLDEDERPLMISDAHGSVAISALPFAFEYAARLCFEDDAIACPADVIRAQLTSARKHVANGMRWVVVAHAFVDGAATSESERPLTRMVGGIETVSAAAFDGAHYVALGHLHRPQPVGQDHIRYSGAPLAFGFDEEGQQKSISLIDLAADGTAIVKEVPLRPLRQVRTIRGKLLELLAATEVSNDIIRVVLTDDTPQIDPMKRIRAFYPNAVQLSYERNERPIAQRLEEQRAVIDDPQTLSSAFLDLIRGEPLSEAEGQIVASALRSFATTEEGQ